MAEDIVEKERFSFDSPIQLFLHGHATPTLDRIRLVLTHAGSVSAAFIAAILIAVNPLVFASETSDSNASGVATYAGANTVDISKLIALLALSASLAWMRSHDAGAAAGHRSAQR